MPPTRSGIPTTFREANFRSRLEARWAAFFDLIGWRWTYEPVDAAGYIPDFLIHGQQGFFVEVGPCVSATDYVAKIDKPDRVAAELGRDVLIVGVSPLADLMTGGLLAAGLLGEFGEFDPGGICLSWGAGIWGGDLANLGVYHEFQSFAHRPHGTLSEFPIVGAGWVRAIEDLWNKAGSNVQWRAAS